MKQSLLIALALSLLLSLAFADDLQIPTGRRPLDRPQGISIPKTRVAPAYTFSRQPTAIIVNYYDYMIGSYNGLPLRVIPDVAGGGYFMTYHCRRQPTSIRRAFYSYIDDQGNIINNNEISIEQANEGYPTMAVDPVSGKPLYAWHANMDGDAEYEVLLSSDAFISGIAGLFNGTEIAINNPMSVTSPSGITTSNNEFLWPTAQIGPSPVAGKRRIYLAARNSIYATYGPSENLMIAYADFNGYDIEMGIPLVFTRTTIPELNQWNVDAQWRRPFYALAADDAGNLYYAGYHTATGPDGTVNIDEPDMDVFVCPNFGQGTWTRYSAYSHLNMWNPASSPTDPTGYFTNPDQGDIPFSSNGELYFSLLNSSHTNASVDNNGKVHVLGIWGLSTYTGHYYPAMQFVKEFVFDPISHEFEINEVYPQKDPTDFYNTGFCPWDREAPWGVVDEFGGNPYDGYYPLMTNDWPFPHWDQTAHADAMFFHYSNTKITNANPQGMMAAVWQNSQRARMFNYFSDTNYSEFANTPEIYISVSPDNGNTWSEPIILNNVETPQFSGIKPMWVYPADQVIYAGMQGQSRVGKLGVMFYNDYTWGSNAISPPYHPTPNGGEVMFMELQILFSEPGPPPTDPFGTPLVLSGSMTVMAGVMVNYQMAAPGDVVAAFVNVGGVPQLRGKETVQLNNGIAGCMLQIFTEINDESISFKVWDASSDWVIDVAETLSSQINGEVGTWPNDLFWLHAGGGLQQSVSLQTGWNMVSLNVHPDNMAIPSIFGNILANVQMVKSPQGIYEPGNPYNTLTQLSDGNGYYVKVSQPCTLVVEGSPIDLSIPIALHTGWNLVAYTPRTAMPVVTAVASMAGNLIQLKGTEGIYEPGNPYSTLSSLSPGKAYWMKLSGGANLIYPASGKSSDVALASETILASPVIKANSQSVLICLDGQPSSGDILMAYVGQELRGIAELISVDGRSGALLQIFSDTAGEQVEFSLLSSAKGSTMSLYPGLLTQPGSIVGDYAQGVYYSLSADQTDVPELTTSLGRAYPNPFSKGTNISLNVGKDAGEIKLEIYNLKGQKVKTLVNGPLNTGSLELWWDGLDDGGRNMASGVYFCRLQSGEKDQKVKLMLVK